MRNKKGLKVFLLCLLVISIAAASGTAIAYMIKSANEAKNEFVPASVTCAVAEEFDGTEKSSVAVQNTGNIEAYIRVRLVSYWANENGVAVGVPSQMPLVDYDEDNWYFEEKENTYYCLKPIKPGKLTPELLNSPIILETTDNNGQTAYQVVEVIAEAIQANGKTDGVNGENGVSAISYAWGKNF